jgi:hypothetical protein
MIVAGCAINNELMRRGHTARLEKGRGYFYFHLGEAAAWLDRTVRVARLSSFTLKKWLDEYQRLKKLNQEIMRPSARRTKNAHG